MAAAKLQGRPMFLALRAIPPNNAQKLKATLKTCQSSGPRIFRLGVNVLLGLVEQAAKALPADAYDLDIWEMHHNQKVDAPSGTALALGRAAQWGVGKP